MFTSLILAVALLGQVPPPPAPMPYASAPSVSTADMIEEMLAQIYVSKGPEAMDKSRKHFGNLLAEPEGESQIRVIYRVYQQRKADAEATRARIVDSQERLAMNEAQLNLQRAKAYRDHLKREFQLSVVQKKQEAALMNRATAYMNWLVVGGYHRGWGYHHHHHHHYYHPRYGYSHYRYK